jgi:hypothetical protein
VRAIIEGLSGTHPFVIAVVRVTPTGSQSNAELWYTQSIFGPDREKLVSTLVKGC